MFFAKLSPELETNLITTLTNTTKKEMNEQKQYVKRDLRLIIEDISP